MVVEVVVQGTEGSALMLGQRLERLGVESIDARMITVGLVGVFDKEYVGLVALREGCGMTLLVEGYATGSYLLDGEGHGGIEMTQQATPGVTGNLPDAEEAQQMVDTVGIEIVGHLGETLCKPMVALGCHGTPVIGGEAPVLSVARKGIGRGTGLTLQAEKTGMAPCLHTGATDTDGDVALEHHTMAVSIVGRMLELLMQMILNEEIDGSSGFIVVFIIHTVVAPLRVVGRAILVTQVAIGRIGAQPRLVVLIETLEGIRSHGALALLSEDAVQVIPLGSNDGVVIDLRQFVEFLLLLAELLHGLLIGEHAHLLKTDIGGVKGKA